MFKFHPSVQNLLFSTCISLKIFVLTIVKPTFFCPIQALNNQIPTLKTNFKSTLTQESY